MSKEYRIIFTGGGSGGHTMPAVALITSFLEYSEKHNLKCEILYIGSRKGVEKEIIKNLSINYKSVSSGKLRRYFSFKNLFDVINIFIGLIQSFFIVRKFKPGLLVSTGGFVSIPPVIASRFLKVPIIIHEQTIDAGLANKIAGRFADVIALTFLESRIYFNERKVEITGLPMRKAIFSGNKNNALKNLNLEAGLPLIYFTGGGLGCHLLNITAVEIIPELLKRYNIVYQTGKSGLNNDYEELLKLKSSLSDELKKRFIVFDFVRNELSDIYAAAEFCVARSGAGTVCELSALNIPALFIPLAIATKNEQYKNARSVADKGGAIIIEEKDLGPELLLKTIDDVFENKKLSAMKESLKKNSIKDGTENFIKIMMKLMEKE